MLEARFRQCPGHRKITRKEYALRFNTQDRDIERTVDFRRCFLPGRRVEMSMIFERILFHHTVCPWCKLSSPRKKNNPESYIEWYYSLDPSVVHVLTCCSSGCSLRYRPIFHPVKTDTSAPIATTDQPFVLSFHHQGLRIVKGEKEDSPKQFRRVRLESWHCDAARRFSQRKCADARDFVPEDLQDSLPGIWILGIMRSRCFVKDYVLPTPDMSYALGNNLLWEFQ